MTYNLLSDKLAKFISDAIEIRDSNLNEACKSQSHCANRLYKLLFISYWGSSFTRIHTHVLGQFIYKNTYPCIGAVHLQEYIPMYWVSSFTRIHTHVLGQFIYKNTYPCIGEVHLQEYIHTQ